MRKFTAGKHSSSLRRYHKPLSQQFDSLLGDLQPFPFTTCALTSPEVSNTASRWQLPSQPTLIADWPWGVVWLTNGQAQTPEGRLCFEMRANEVLRFTLSRCLR